MNKQFGVVLAALLLGTLPVLAVDIQFTGMARTSFAVTTDSGDFILAEQALHTALDGYGEKSAFHVSPAAAVSVVSGPDGGDAGSLGARVALFMAISSRHARSASSRELPTCCNLPPCMKGRVTTIFMAAPIR